MEGLKPFVVSLACLSSLLPTMAHGSSFGSSPSMALEDCEALGAAGISMSGTYWIRPPGSNPRTAYCDMETNGGGWTLLYNSVLGINTTDFWNIPYLDRFGRKGKPGIDTLFYDGGLYQYGNVYMDVIEDLQGKIVVAMVAEASGMDPYSMRFESPRYVSGHWAIYSAQFAAGWSAPDFDGDTLAGGACAIYYGNVTQHYGGCWNYNLGADADGTVEDGKVGPHLYSPTAIALGLSTDGSAYTRVRRITRYVKW